MENKQYKDNMNKAEQILKRSVDFIIATCCLIFFFPLALVCAIAIHWEDGLPVIYRQERIGLHGKPFFIYKFRSMKIDAEKDGPDLLEIDQIMEHDPRYEYLYQIRPGVTSYATLYNGYTDTMEKMLRRLDLDLYYLENRSWWLDAKILIKTFINIVFGKKF